MVPSEGIGETALLGKNPLFQFGRLPLQKFQLTYFGLDIQLVVIVVAVGFRLVDGMNAGHGCGSFDVRDPHGCDLLEANGETDVLDILAVDRADV